MKSRTLVECNKCGHQFYGDNQFDYKNKKWIEPVITHCPECQCKDLNKLTVRLDRQGRAVCHVAAVTA